MPAFEALQLAHAEGNVAQQNMAIKAKAGQTARKWSKSRFLFGWAPRRDSVSILAQWMSCSYTTSEPSELM